MSIDWDKLEQDNKSTTYTEYAKPGIHKVKVDRMELRTVSTGSIAQEFFFEEDSYKYPKVTHWLSFKNDAWRVWHNKQILELFGVASDSAKKLIENAESKGDKEAVAKAYQAMYDKVINGKQPEVEIEVWADGKYNRADFNAYVRMARPEEQQVKETKEDVLEDAEPADDLDNIPF